MKKLFIIVNCLLLFSLFSCATRKSIDNIFEYQTQLLPKTEVFPNQEQLINKDIKIGIVKFQNNFRNNLKLDHDLSSFYTKELEKALIKTKLVKPQNIVIIEDESNVFEKADFDYIIKSQIIDNDIENRYYIFANSPNINMSSSYFITALINVYKSPSYEKIKSFEISGLYSKKSSSNLFVTKPNEINITFFENSIVDSLNHNLDLFRSLFLQQGFIIGKKQKGKNSIFEINLGYDHGLKQSDKLKIIKQKIVKNPLKNNQEEIEEELLSFAFVSNIINKESSFIMLEEKQNAKKIKNGDLVKIIYEFNYVDSKSRYDKEIQQIYQNQRTAENVELFLNILLFALEESIKKR